MLILKTLEPKVSKSYPIMSLKLIEGKPKYSLTSIKKLKMTQSDW